VNNEENLMDHMAESVDNKKEICAQNPEWESTKQTHRNDKEDSSSKKSKNRPANIDRDASDHYSTAAHIDTHSGSKNDVSTQNEDDDLLFWSETSVRVSTSIIRAKGSHKFASLGQLAVVTAAKTAIDTTPESLYLVSAKLSQVLLSEGADHSIAAAAVIGCLNRDFKEGDDEYIN